MNNPKLNDIIDLSNKEIIEKISTTEIEIFNLRFKKATRQTFKSHELKFFKKKLARLKTLLNERVTEMKKQEKSTLNNLLSN